MFKVKSNPQLNKESFVFSPDSLYPYFTRTIQNNGILGYVDYLDEEHLLKGNSIAVGMLGMQFFYMSHDFYAGQFTKTIYPKRFELNDKSGLYFATLFNKQKEELLGVLVRDFEDTFLSRNVEVPINNNAIDFSFISKYIKGLIDEQLSLIDGYLAKNNLSDPTLTPAEEDALCRLKAGEVRWRSIVMEKAFEPVKAPYLRKGTRRQDHVSKVRTNEFCLPVVCAKRGDNGIMYYGRKEDFTAHSNLLSIIYNGAIAAGLIYAHEDEVGIYTDSYLVRYRGTEVPFAANLFMKTAIEKKIFPMFSREHKAVWPRVKTTQICLPINNENKTDITFMQNLIRAEMKLAAKEILAYKDSLTNIPVSYPAFMPYSQSPSMAAEPIEHYGSVGVFLPERKNTDSALTLMYAIGPNARQQTQEAGHIALGIKETKLREEVLEAYRDVKRLVFHYWKNETAAIVTLSQGVRVVEPSEVPEGYMLRQEKGAVLYLLLDYNPADCQPLQGINILPLQRQKQLRYMPFITSFK